MAFTATAAWAVILSVRHRRFGERLERWRAHIGELFESSADAVVLVDREGLVKWGSDAFSELFGYSPTGATSCTQGAWLRASSLTHICFRCGVGVGTFAGSGSHDVYVSTLCA